MNQVSRRSFLKSSAKLGTLAIALSATPMVLGANSADSGNVTPCLRFTEDGRIILCVPIPDMGQGMITTAAQLIAEELDIDLNKVELEMMAYQGHTDKTGKAVEGEMLQGAGGSWSTIGIWGSLRNTAAFARALFIEAASVHLDVPSRHLSTADGMVVDQRSGRKVAYGQLVNRAQNASETFSLNSVEPKPISDHKIIGKDRPNLNARAIALGEPLFSLDVEIAGMLHAAIRRCPNLDGTLESYDRDSLLAMPGVEHIVEIKRIPENRNKPRIVAAGVAVIADTHWNARSAADKMAVRWNGEVSATDDSAILKSTCMDALENSEMDQAEKGGDITKAFVNAAKTVEATYFHPHWAHTCIEPHNCVADVKDDAAEIWVGHQSMTGAINAVVDATGLSADKVTCNLYRMGTGLGRKYVRDFVMEAAILSKKVKAPVKVTWSREDEIEQDYVNPMAAYKLKASLDANGGLTGWHLRCASDASLWGAPRELPCGLIENYLGEGTQIKNRVRRGAWRGPQHNTAGWVIQGFLNELAYAAGKDPLAFLLELYSGKQVVKLTSWPYPRLEISRFAALLKKVAKEADFGKKMPNKWGQGIAVHHTFSSTCAHVVDLEMLDDSKDFRVHKVTSAIDCGFVVNPLGVKAQIESGINDGICAALYGNLVYERGVPVSNNFDSYQKMRINEAPPVINSFLMDFGDELPRGTGEVSLPPIIPALTNAIFAASGKRIRTLPLRESL